MSGYLTNLAARALGVSEVARPRPSLFEPRRGVEPPSFQAEAEVPEARPEPESAREQSPSRRPVEPPPPGREETETSASEPDQEPQPVPQARPVPDQAPRREKPWQPPSAPTPPKTIEPLVFEPGAAVVEAGRRRPVHVPALLRPARLPPRVLPPKRAAESTVRVTIGRIDVRAVKPDAPPEPRKKRKPAQHMSLDEYLARSSR